MTMVVDFNWFALVVSGLAVSLGVRIIIAALRAIEPAESSRWRVFWGTLRGLGAPAGHTNDYYTTLVLGMIETIGYVVCFSLGKPEYVGAWIALKTLPHWKTWTEQRWIYNRYLIGNALVVLASWMIAEHELVGTYAKVFSA